jgi:hypothetical protein
MKSFGEAIHHGLGGKGNHVFDCTTTHGDPTDPLAIRVIVTLHGVDVRGVEGKPPEVPARQGHGLNEAATRRGSCCSGL